MKELARYAVVGLGGCLGAMTRFAVNAWVFQRWGAAFPYGTFLINVSGSFVLGLFGTLSFRLAWNDHWRLLIAVGFLGAYTTFSTFSLETLQLLIQDGKPRAALLNVLASVFCGVAAAYLGVLAAGFLISLRPRS